MNRQQRRSANAKIRKEGAAYARKRATERADAFRGLTVGLGYTDERANALIASWDAELAT